VPGCTFGGDSDGRITVIAWLVRTCQCAVLHKCLHTCGVLTAAIATVMGACRFHTVGEGKRYKNGFNWYGSHHLRHRHTRHALLGWFHAITPEGNNWVNVMELPLRVCGWGMVIGGVILLLNFASLLYKQNNVPDKSLLQLRFLVRHLDALRARKSAVKRVL